MTHLVPWNGAGLMPAAFVNPWRVFDELASTPQWPVFDTEETEDAVLITADLPGMREEDLELTLAGRSLTISGQTRRKRFSGSFSRRYILAEGLDAEHIEASLRDGVLTVVVPKTAAAKPRRIKLVDRMKNLLGKGDDTAA